MFSELLLFKGPSVNLRDIDGPNPLCIAVLKGHLAVLVLLLSKGADANLGDTDGASPLQIAPLHCIMQPRMATLRYRICCCQKELAPTKLLREQAAIPHCTLQPTMATLR